MIFISVFLLSMASLSFEVLLARVFAIGQWNHLSFMVISIALFGFGASGTFLSVLNARKSPLKNCLFADHTLFTLHVLYSVAALAAIIALNQLPLDYFRIILDPLQLVYLLLGFTVLSAPFFITGLVMGVGYAKYSHKTGQVYGASMSGSAAGALLPLFLVSLWGEERLIVLSALLPLSIFLCKAFYSDAVSASARPPSAKWGNRFVSGIAWMILATGLFLIIPLPIDIVRVEPSDYKSLRQYLRMPGTRVTATHTDIRGRLDVVESPFIRQAPGLSLKYQKTLPPQTAIFRDGDDPFTLYPAKHSEALAFAHYLPSSLAYAIRSPVNRVLLAIQNGGSAIPCAVANNPRQLTIVIKSPTLARLVRQHYHMPVTARDLREYLARATHEYDVIHIENWGTTVPGASALDQNYDYTTDAFMQYMQHLTGKGALIISRKLLLPPSDSLRMWAAAFESLRQLGMKHPEHHLLLFRNWDTYTLCVFKRPIQDGKTIREVLRDLNFDLVYLGDIRPEEVNLYNRYDRPFYFTALQQLAVAYGHHAEKRFFDNYLLDVRPQTDDRPFPGRYLKWQRLRHLHQSTGKRSYALMLSGEIVIAAVFVEAVGISIILLGCPLLLTSRLSGKDVFRQTVYFTGIGAGFILLEVFFIQHYTFLLGDPVISFALVLGGVLSASGAGGLFAQKLDQRTIGFCLLALILLLALMVWGFDGYLAIAREWPPPVQIWQCCSHCSAGGFYNGDPLYHGHALDCCR